MVRVGRVGQLLLLGLLACGGAHAAEPTTGFYLGASAGAARHDVDNGGAQGQIVIGIADLGALVVSRSGLKTDSDSTGWRGLAGYRFTRYLAAELEYLDFGSSRIDESYVFDLPFFPFPSEPITIHQRFETDVSGPAVSALGKLPLGERLELFLRAGMLFADSKVRMAQRSTPTSITYSDRVLIGGAGVDWNFAGRWSARLEYQRSKNIEPNLDIAESHVELLSLGVLFKL
jgi:hypothetical protein